MGKWDRPVALEPVYFQRDVQQDLPAAWCEKCGMEVWRFGEALCEKCREMAQSQREEENGELTIDNFGVASRRIVNEIPTVAVAPSE